MQKISSLLIISLWLTFTFNSSVFAQVESAFTDMELVFEEVEDIQVTSLTGTAKEFKTTPAAVYVITQNDIRNSGATNIAELLRQVPGLQAGVISANSWSVSIRGFSGRYSGNLQCLVDGRSVYNPLFSGVYWDSLSLIMEDIERIEVIRGPGSTLWGANAVNGVINIVTKNSKKTESCLVQAIAGSEENEAVLRFGSSLSDNVSFRLYGTYFDRDGFVDLQGDDIDDSNESKNFGTRFDFKEDDLAMSLTLEAFDNEKVNVGTGIDPSVGSAVVNKNPELIRGGFASYKVRKEFSSDAGIEFLTYYDNHERDDTLLTTEQNVIFAELRHNFKLGYNNDLSWGLGYKKSENESETFVQGSVEFLPSSRDIEIFSCFIQDTFSVSDDLFLMFGAKYEDSDVTGGDFQPSARLSYKFNDDLVWWASYTQAIRSPSIAELDIKLPVAYMPLPTGGVMPVYMTGDPDVDVEKLTAVETGLRINVSEALSLDLSLFVNEYEDVIYQNASILSITNEQEATIQGGEIFLKYNPSGRFSLTAAVSVLDVDFDLSDIRDESEAEVQYSLLSQIMLTDSLSLNTELYYQDEKKSLMVDSFLKADLGLVYRPVEGFEISLWGINLTEDETEQYYDYIILKSREQVERSVYLKFKMLK